MSRVYRHILPDVDGQLRSWTELAGGIPDPELRKQALASIESKRFHCQGGAVYAAANLPQKHVLIPLIVALQTISDYLDNLCDRSTSLDPVDFRQLHQSMLDAVNPTAVLKDYYEYRSEKDDGGYLHKLVKTCQSCICMLPSYHLVQASVEMLVGYYCDLQVHKHIRHDLREGELLAWWERHKEAYEREIGWNEFAAAAGSTLGMFMLFLAASDKDLTPAAVRQIREAYFPYVCGLHILLDYLIDQEEDRVGGDLNFCNYYGSTEETERRIAEFARRARLRVMELPDASFHRMIIEGLLALYLSDPKVKGQREVRNISKQLMKNSPLMRLFFLLNSLWIRKKESKAGKFA